MFFKITVLFFIWYFYMWYFVEWRMRNQKNSIKLESLQVFYYCHLPLLPPLIFLSHFFPRRHLHPQLFLPQMLYSHSPLSHIWIFFNSSTSFHYQLPLILSKRLTLSHFFGISASVVASRSRAPERQNEKKWECTNPIVTDS